MLLKLRDEARLDAAQAAGQARILELASIRESWSLRTLLRGSSSEVVAWGENDEQQCDVPAGLTGCGGDFWRIRSQPST